MPIELSRAKALISEFEGRERYPKENRNALRALATALANHAHNDDHADLIIRSIHESGGPCPIISDILRIAGETRPQFQTPQKYCDECIDGWCRVWFLTDKRGGKTWKHHRITEYQANVLAPQLDPRQQEITEAAERCSCAGGGAKRMEPGSQAQGAAKEIPA